MTEKVPLCTLYMDTITKRIIHLIYFTAIIDNYSYNSDILGVLSNECDHYFGNDLFNYWISPDNVQNGQFVLDLKHQIMIKKVTLKNAHNKDNRDR